MSVPFYWRRQFPLTVLALATSVLAIRAAMHHDLVSSFAAVLVAAYGLGCYRWAARRYARWLGWAALAGAVFVVATSHGSRMEGAPLALLGAAFVLGDAASARRAESAAAVESAHQGNTHRIARELHDVVAHQLSAIAVQAGAARLAAAGAADPVIGTVEQLSREALAELNHLLGALRQEPDAKPPRTATPGLGDLDGLLAASRAAGTRVRLAVTGQPGSACRPACPCPATGSSRERLANVARHAPRAATTVTLDYRAGQLDVEIVNAALPAGRRSASAHCPTGGRGVRGMRERAELHGGQLTAGAEPGGGFAVRASIPDAPAGVARV